MIQHERFLEQLRQMHLDVQSDGVLLSVITTLRQKALKNLREKYQRITKELETVSSSDTVQAYDQQIRKDLETISRLITQLEMDIKTSKQAVLESELSNPSAPIWTTFNQKFAEFFPNLQLLIHTLSDAPEEIKQQLLPLTTLVLNKIQDPREKQEALRALSDENLKQIIAESIKTYNVQGIDKDLTLRSKAMAQLCIAELIGRAAPLAPPTNNSYRQYQETIQRLQNAIPEIGLSDILDDISDNYPNIQTTIERLLPSIDWQNPDALKAVQATQAFYQKIRYGQKDLREYVAETKKRLGNDLFWAENIYETRLFTPEERDRLYKEARQMNQIDVLNHFIKDTTPSANKKVFASSTHPHPMDTILSTPRSHQENYKKYQKLLWALQQVKHDFNATNPEKIYKTFIQHFFQTPTIEKTGKTPPIKITFYRSNLQQNPSTDSEIKKTFKMPGVKNMNADLISKNIMPGNIDFLTQTEAIVIEGESIEAIYNQLNLHHPDIASQYNAYIENHFPETDIPTLSLTQDLSLRKLLELHQFKTRFESITKQSIHALSFLSPELVNHLLSGNMAEMKEALDTPNLNQTINHAYKAIASLNSPVISNDSILATTQSKAQKILGATERKEKFHQALETALNAIEALRRQKIIEVYQAEYNSPEILETLGIQNNPDAIDAMNQDIEAMATELERLMIRTSHGTDIIDPKENNAYFDL
ncbi:MAG TPA: hypothetical protein VHD33_03345, partial [Legionellaceae bacterium]|nr:hypothetical protein [Legionellaceae bacterium]